MGKYPRVWRAYLGAGAAAVAASLAAPPQLQDALDPALGLAATALLVRRAGSSPSPTRAPWTLFALALALLTAGDLVATYFDASGGAGFPSLADALYLGAYPLLALGFTWLAGRGRPGADRAARRDAAAVVAALGIPAWVWVATAVLDRAPVSFAGAAATAYPFMGLLILAVLARQALARPVAARSPVLVLGGAAVVARLGADLAYSAVVQTPGFDTGGLVDVGRLACYVLWGCAALHPEATAIEAKDRRDFDPRLRALLLGTATMVGPAHQIGLALTAEQRFRLTTGLLSAVVSGLVAARLARLLAEVNQHMTESELGRAALERALMDKRALEDQLAQRSLHDPLTGLATKALLLDRVEASLTRAERTGARPALIYLDLDDFKAMNERLGHEAGDQVLAEVAARLTGALRAEDTAARVGGEEFAVLLENVSEDETNRIAERVQRGVCGRLSIAGRSVEVRATLGVAHAAPGGRAADLLFNAAIAAAAAKEQGSTRWLVFDEARQSSVLRRVELVRGLEQALARDELLLHYQPIVDLTSGRITGVEPLLRWRHPRRGLLPAGEFIDAAASDPEVMARIDEDMGEVAIAQIANWRRTFPAVAGLTLSLNASPSVIGRPGFVERIAHLLEVHGLPAPALVLEITERELVGESTQARSALDRLRALGVGIAIDDFGTGYSSLGYLRHLPVAVLKIDRAFIELIPGEAEDRALVAAIVKIGHTKRLKVIAEGVERPEQVKALQAMGCRYGQGFGLVEPVSPQDLATLLGDGALVALPGSLAKERQQLVRRRNRRAQATRPRLEVPVVGDDDDRLGR